VLIRELVKITYGAAIYSVLTGTAAYVKEAELVPDYGYHQNHPIIYIRKTHRQDPFLNANPRKIAGKPMPPSSLYYKFRNARGMDGSRILFRDCF
jgi:hypothetical protein